MASQPMKRVFLVTTVATLLAILLTTSVTLVAYGTVPTTVPATIPGNGGWSSVPGTVAQTVPGTLPGTVPGVVDNCSIGYEVGTLNAGQMQTLTYTAYDPNGTDVTSLLEVSWTAKGSGQLSTNAGKTTVLLAKEDGGSLTTVEAYGTQVGKTTCNLALRMNVVQPAATPTPVPVATTVAAAADIVAVPVETGAVVTVAHPNVSTTVTAPTNDVVIVVPSLATANTVQMEYKPTSVDTATGFVQKGEPSTIFNAFEINLYDAQGVAQENVVFLNPITLKVKFTQANLDAVNGDFAALKVLQYVTDQWIALNTTVDFVNKELTASVSHLSYFAIGAAAEEVPVVATATPATPTPTPEPVATLTHRYTPLMTPPGVGGTAPSPGLLLAMALVAVVFISSGAYYLKQTRSTATEE